jgi:hypothetical protein
MVEQDLDDEDRSAQFKRRRPNGFTVHEKDHIIYVTQGHKNLFRDTQWTVEQLSFVAGNKSVSSSVCHDLLLKISIRKVDRVKVIKNLGRTLMDEPENLFRSY